MDLAFLMAVGLSSLICVIVWSTGVFKKVVPSAPSPRGLPFLGHLHLLGPLPHISLANLSRTYGPLLSLRFGSRRALVVSSPSMANLILHTHDTIFAGRPHNFIIPSNATLGCPEIAFSSPGPYWKLMRQLCFADLFSAKRLNCFRPVRMQEVRRLLQSISAAKGKAICIREKLHNTTTNVIARMVLSRSLQEIGEDMPNSEEILAAVMELLRMVGEFNVSDYIPSVAWMDLQGYGRRSKKLAHITSVFFQQEIERRRRECSHDPSSPPRDFLDALLAASLDPRNTHLKIEDGHIRAVIQDMFFAGTDTSSTAIEWALAELLLNPPVLNTLQEELDEHVGRSRLVQETDLPNLPYLQAVVNETLRLHTIAPLLVPHMSVEPSEIAGYKIARNTLVYVNAWAIHRDPNVWENPLEFYPERFLKCKVDDMARQCAFMPFGIGRRACPGARLGLLNVQNLLANLVHAFNWQTLGKVELKEKFGLTLVLDEPLVIVPTPRLPTPLLETFM